LNLQTLVDLLDGSADGSDISCHQALTAATTMTGSPQGSVVIVQGRRIQAVYQGNKPDDFRRLTDCDGKAYFGGVYDALFAAVDQQRPLIFNSFHHECPDAAGLPHGGSDPFKRPRHQISQNAETTGFHRWFLTGRTKRI